MKQVFESSRISFVEVSEQLVNDYLTMVNDYENINRFIGGKHILKVLDDKIAANIRVNENL